MLVGPFGWWGAHPWVVVWSGIFAAPFVVLGLRVCDEVGWASLVEPLGWLSLTAFVAVLTFGAAVTARVSLPRAGGAVLVAAAALLAVVGPMTNVVVGRTACPARAGHEHGVGVAMAVLDDWRAGKPGDARWVNERASEAWRAKSGAITLMDYVRVGSGCWDRMAPVSASPTWHEFRVTVKEGTARAPLSKIVVVHTTGRDGAWKISGVDGPLP